MRWLPVLLLCACTQLPDLPDAEPEITWTCDQGFEEAIHTCNDDDCNGLLYMNSKLDHHPMEFATDRVDVVLIEDSGLLDSVEVVGITTYFNNRVLFERLDVDDEGEASQAMIIASQDHPENPGTHLTWEAWNSDEPMHAEGRNGVVRVDLYDEGLAIVFLATTGPHVQLVEGCLYAHY